MLAGSPVSSGCLEDRHELKEVPMHDDGLQRRKIVAQVLWRGSLQAAVVASSVSCLRPICSSSSSADHAASMREVSQAAQPAGESAGGWLTASALALQC